MVALDLDDPILDRAAGAALFLELRAEFRKLRRCKGNSHYEGDAFTFAPFRLPAHANNSIFRHRIFGRGCVSLRAATGLSARAVAPADRLTAVGTHSPRLR